MIMSTSLAATPAFSSASVHALAAISAPPSPGSTQRRSSMPERSTIHSWVVSMTFDRSSLVTTRGGT